MTFVEQTQTKLLYWGNYRNRNKFNNRKLAYFGTYSTGKKSGMLFFVFYLN